MWFLIGGSLLLSFLMIPRWFSTYHIYRWRQNLDLQKHWQNYKKAFANINGYSLSQHSREESDAIEYTYGEIDFFGFIALVGLTKPDVDTVFFDLGSGIGTAVLACALVYPVKKSYGIELFSKLHDAAILAAQQLHQLAIDSNLHERTEFINSNFLHQDLGEATLIFINASALFGETWQKLNHHLEHTASRAIIITTSKQLITVTHQVVHTTRVAMNWGIVHAFIHTPKNSSLHEYKKFPF